MPEISRFYGIVIKMYFADHAPPHFHAEYAEFEARIAIDTLAVLSGDLPARPWGSSWNGRRCIGRSFTLSGSVRVGCKRSRVSIRFPDEMERHNIALHPTAASRKSACGVLW